MQFLKTLFWVLLAVVVALFASRNWSDVTLNLWGDIQADIKLPILLLIAFVIGFAPTWSLMRTRIWSQRRRIDAIFDRAASLIRKAVLRESGISKSDFEAQKDKAAQEKARGQEPHHGLPEAAKQQERGGMEM